MREAFNMDQNTNTNTETDKPSSNWLKNFFKWLKDEFNNLMARICLGKEKYLQEYERQLRANPDFTMHSALAGGTVSKKNIELNNSLDKKAKAKEISNKETSIKQKYCNIEVREAPLDKELPKDKFILLSVTDDKKLYIDVNDLENNVTDVNLINSHPELKMTDADIKNTVIKMKEIMSNINACHIKDAKDYMRVTQRAYEMDDEINCKDSFKFFSKAAIAANENTPKLMWQSLNRGAEYITNVETKNGEITKLKSNIIAFENAKLILTPADKRHTYDIKVFDNERKSTDITNKFNFSKIHGLNCKEIINLLDKVKDYTPDLEIEKSVSSKFVVIGDSLTEDMLPDNTGEMKTIIIPDRVTSIENGILSKCKSLEEIEFHGTTFPITSSIIENEIFATNTYNMLQKIKAEVDMELNKQVDKDHKEVADFEDAKLNTVDLREYSEKEIKDRLEEPTMYIPDPKQDIVLDNSQNPEKVKSKEPKPQADKEKNIDKELAASSDSLTKEKEKELIAEKNPEFMKVTEASIYRDIVIEDSSLDVTQTHEETVTKVETFGDKIKRIENQHKEITIKGKDETEHDKEITKEKEYDIAM